MSETERQRFIGEAKAASALDRPNIAAVFEIDETADGRSLSSGPITLVSPEASAPVIAPHLKPLGYDGRLI